MTDEHKALVEALRTMPQYYDRAHRDIEREAASAIESLSERADKLQERSLDNQRLAFGWMEQHDKLLGFVQSYPEFLAKLIESDPRGPSPSPVDRTEDQKRAERLEAEIQDARSLAFNWLPNKTMDDGRDDLLEAQLAKAREAQIFYSLCEKHSSYLWVTSTQNASPVKVICPHCEALRRQDDRA